mmetsp:Transcript_40981/g.121523  ORF Transcript_40981/g.121523 Transcript_40981/m.121523 type:complete len:336 (-) Transcript_40981:3-1010(-)
MFQAEAVRGPPVGLHEASEAHLVLEVAQRGAVLARVVPVDLVVRAHRGVDAGVDRGLERRVVELPERLLVDVRGLLRAVRLLLVHDEVLHHGEDVLRVHALDVRHHEPRAEVRILAGEVLEVAAAPRHAVHVDGGPQDRVGALGGELLAEGGSEGFHGVDVPGCGQAEQGGPRGDRPDQRVPIRAEAIRGVLHVEAGDAQLGDGRGVPHIDPHVDVEVAGIGRVPADAVHELALLLVVHLRESPLGVEVRLVPGEELEGLAAPRAHLGLRQRARAVVLRAHRRSRCGRRLTHGVRGEGLGPHGPGRRPLRGPALPQGPRRRGPARDGRLLGTPAR